MRSGLGIFLEREITRAGVSLNEFARRASVSPATLSRLVNGQQRSANHATLEKIAKALGHDVWGLELLGTPIHVDYSDFPEVESPPAMRELELAIEREIDKDARIPPRRKKWLKQCVEFARTAP